MYKSPFKPSIENFRLYHTFFSGIYLEKLKIKSILIFNFLAGSGDLPVRSNSISHPITSVRYEIPSCLVYPFLLHHRFFPNTQTDIEYRLSGTRPRNYVYV